ncbi:DUF6615 family protein [Mucilaginibacter sp. OK098]|uniref:DUF6615 family protein n=1 Tax=Mucilaginibacter sp. OK098 TaxID=1855297 RepID=UPI00090F3DFA|nr:DUF6615 family protein [Mucilaginibacter sp. OK098]SHL96114.1 hypothetical protein SAMN05216524_101329 [Mucilaginibacter sp. OK098]
MSLLYYLDPLNPPDECDIFKAAAKDSWARIRFSRIKPRLKIHETTITQNLVYEMRLLKAVYPHLGFSLFESTMEDTHGDDLELCIEQNDGRVITYALQAKIIYHTSTKKWIKLGNGNYKQMNHYVGIRRANQVQLLIDYAKSLGQIPMYLLYNYVLKRTAIKTGVDNDLYGCTVVTAEYLQANHGLSDGNLKATVKFNDLHPSPAIPWHELICRFTSLRDIDILTEIGLPGYPLRSRTLAETLDNPEWLPVDVHEDSMDNIRQGNLQTLLEQEKKEANGPAFRPRFRLLFRPGSTLN